MKAEIIENLKELLEKKKQTESDLRNVEFVLSHGGPYYIEGNMSSTSIPKEYAVAMLNAHIKNLKQQLREIDKELEDL